MKESRVPEIGEFVRGTGTLVSVEKIVPNPPPPTEDYIFEEIESKIELRLNNEIITTIASLNDFYGLETGVVAAIKDAKEYAKTRGIGRNSDVEVLVVKTAIQFRAWAAPGAFQNFYDSDYPRFERLSTGSHRNVKEPVDTTVWSSKEGEQ